MEEGRRQGALTVAITNGPHSPLAKAAEYIVLLHAGEEQSIAATKTYTASLLALAMLSAALAEDTARFRALEILPDVVAEVLKSASIILGAAERYRYMEACVVISRGYNYATAFEIALKLKELFSRFLAWSDSPRRTRFPRSGRCAGGLCCKGTDGASEATERPGSRAGNHLRQGRCPGPGSDSPAFT